MTAPWFVSHSGWTRAVVSDDNNYTGHKYCCEILKGDKQPGILPSIHRDRLYIESQMVDTISEERRSWNMSRIRSKNTKPELIVRSLLHSMGVLLQTEREGLKTDPPKRGSSRKTILLTLEMNFSVEMYHELLD